MTDEQEVIEAVETVEEQVEAVEEDTGVVVEIGGEEAEDEAAPEWVKNLRRENRELRKQVKAAQVAPATPQITPLPPEPTLESCDYDEAVFRQKSKEWVRLEIEHQQREAEQKTAAEKAEQRWNERLQRYDDGKTKIGAPDFDDAEAVAMDILAKPVVGIPGNDARIGMIKHVARNAPMLMYALGRNPERAKALAAIEDPGEYLFALGEFSGRMKVVTNKAPAPERKIGGTVPGVKGAVDNALDRLREEAAKTGDYSKVTRYKREKGL